MQIEENPDYENVKLRDAQIKIKIKKVLQKQF